MSVVPPRRIAPAIGLVCALHAWLLWWAFANGRSSRAAQRHGLFALPLLVLDAASGRCGR